MDFDHKAKSWDADPQRNERASVFAEEILKILRNEVINRVLEFGSGTGLVSFHLKNSFPSVTLADTSKGMMEVLHNKIEIEKLDNFHPLLINDTTDLLPQPPFDAVYTLLTLHHVHDIESAFAVFSKTIRKGGYLFIGDLVTEDGSFHYRDPEFNGHKGFDTEELKKKLGVAGFKCLAEKIIFTITRDTGSEIRKYPLFMLALKKI